VSAAQESAELLKAANRLTVSVLSRIPYPLGSNELTDAQLEEILSRCPLYDTHPWSLISASKLRDLKLIDVTIFTSDLAIQGHVQRLLGEIAFPLIPNQINDNIETDIANDELFDVAYPKLELAQLRSLDEFMITDLQAYVSTPAVNDLLQKKVIPVDFPLAPNDADQSVLDEITDAIFPDELNWLPRTSIWPVIDFALRLIVDSDVLYASVGEWLGTVLSQAPIISNDVDDNTTYAIVAPALDPRALINRLKVAQLCDYTPTDTRLFVQPEIADHWVDTIFATLRLPIKPNLVLARDVFDILDSDFGIIQAVGEIEIDKLSVPMTGLQLYVNERIVGALVSPLWTATPFPLVDNVPDDRVHVDIADDPLEDVFELFVIRNADWLYEFSVPDAQQFANDRTAYQMIDATLEEFGLPLIDNDHEIMNAFRTLCNIDYTDIIGGMAHLEIDPISRFDPTLENVLYDVMRLLESWIPEQLPLAGKPGRKPPVKQAPRPRPVAAVAPASALAATPTPTLTLAPAPSPTTAPTAMVAPTTPPPIDEWVTAYTAQLFDRIVKQDVCSCLPLEIYVDDDLLDALLDALLSNKRALSSIEWASTESLMGLIRLDLPEDEEADYSEAEEPFEEAQGVKEEEEAEEEEEEDKETRVEAEKHAPKRTVVSAAVLQNDGEIGFSSAEDE
jgi:hypothetical protein